jgi:alkylation response protein AidB-like acyl-CoA dehydrogenase
VEPRLRPGRLDLRGRDDSPLAGAAREGCAPAGARAMKAPMRLELDDDQRLIQESVRRFAEAELAPHAYAWDKAAALPAQVFAGLAELGLTGMWVGPELGGTGLGWRAAVLALEELARGDASVAVRLLEHGAQCLPALALGEGAHALAAGLSSGEVIAAWAHAEPEGGELGGLATVAERTASGWRLVGHKSSVLAAPAASRLVISARVEGAPGLFVVPAGAAGLTASPLPGRLGLRGAGAVHLSLDGVELAEDARLSLGPDPSRALSSLLVRASVGAAAISVGVGRAALEAARGYALERRQFGKPIAELQAIQWKLADAAMELDAARLLVAHAAGLADADDGAASSSLVAAAAKARVFASESAVRAAMQAVQVFGGNGFVREYPVERLLRDAKVLELEGGPTGRHRQALAAALLAS